MKGGIETQKRKEVYVIFWQHTEDFRRKTSDVAALRCAELLSKYGLKGCFMLTGTKALTISERSPELVEALKNHCIGYHGDGHSRKFMEPGSGDAFLSKMSWEEGVKEKIFMETHTPEIMPPGSRGEQIYKLEGSVAGERKIGGIKAVESLFNRKVLHGCLHPHGSPQLIAAYKELGIKVLMNQMLFINRRQLEFPAVWYMGLLVPLSLPLLSEKRFREDFDLAVSLQPERQSVIFTRPMEPHDWNMAMPNETPEEQEERFRRLEGDIRFVASRHDIKVITYDDFVDMVEWEETVTLSKEEVVESSEYILTNWENRPPDYVTAGEKYLTLAEAFQALVNVLVYYAEHGVLPQKVKVYDFYGPTEYVERTPQEMHRTQGILESHEILSLSKELKSQIDMIKRIPGVIATSMGKMNPAEILFALAQEVKAIDDQGASTHVLLTAANVLPRSTDGIDTFPIQPELLELSKIVSSWTLKPAKPRKR